MTNEKPLEPSAIFAADGTRVPYRNGPAPAATSDVLRPLLPALIRAATAGPFVTASALLLSGAAAAKVTEVAGRAMWQAARAALGNPRGPRPVPGGLDITWIHVEVRWPPTPRQE
jgi:hypothetical protein